MVYKRCQALVNQNEKYQSGLEVDFHKIKTDPKIWKMMRIFTKKCVFKKISIEKNMFIIKFFRK